MQVDDSQPQRRANRKWVPWTILGVVAFLIAFAIYTLPRPRAEFVGIWRCEQHPKQILRLRNDGQFDLNSYYLLPGYADTQWFEVSGTWVADHDNLYLTATSVRQSGRIALPKRFNELKTKLINRKKRVHVTRLTQGKISINLVEDEWSQQSFVRASPP